MPKTWKRVGEVFNQNSTFMKKFRMMLPLVAFVFAMVGAVAGDLLPVNQGYYKTGATTCSAIQPTEQADCRTDLPSSKPQCTILVGSNIHAQAFEQNNCSIPLRYNN